MQYDGSIKIDTSINSNNIPNYEINIENVKRLREITEKMEKTISTTINVETTKRSVEVLNMIAKDSLSKLLSVFEQFDYSAVYRNMTDELSKLARINLGYDTEIIRKSIGNMVESLSVLQIEQLKQIANVDYSKAFSSTYVSLDSMRNIINVAYTASQEYANSEADRQESEEDLLTAEEAIETICEHMNNSVGIIERISTWSQEKIRKYWIIVAILSLMWNIFVLPYLQENIGKPVMATFASNVKELPEKGATIICQLKENIEAYIIENINYYYKVSFIDENGVKREGYVAKRNLKIIQVESKENDEEDLTQEDSQFNES